MGIERTNSCSVILFLAHNKIHFLSIENALGNGWCTTYQSACTRVLFAKRANVMLHFHYYELCTALYKCVVKVCRKYA